jgi:hypothetical protein
LVCYEAVCLILNDLVCLLRVPKLLCVVECLEIDRLNHFLTETC